MSGEKDLIAADLEILADHLLAALDQIASVRAAVEELPARDLTLMEQLIEGGVA